MNGRDGGYPAGVGSHVTRVFDVVTDGRDAFAVLCNAAGVDAAKYNALATCTCRWSRGAISVASVRTRAFYHRMAQ